MEREEGESVLADQEEHENGDHTEVNDGAATGSARDLRQALKFRQPIPETGGAVGREGLVRGVAARDAVRRWFFEGVGGVTMPCFWTPGAEGVNCEPTCPAPLDQTTSGAR